MEDLALDGYSPSLAGPYLYDVPQRGEPFNFKGPAFQQPLDIFPLNEEDFFGPVRAQPGHIEYPGLRIKPCYHGCEFGFPIPNVTPWGLSAICFSGYTPWPGMS
ncbi:MAG: hypothetical protein KatS3mg054_0039 [Chloroflexus sp.]|nr:MAG: hypothetical protein KatS3mg054_0039 [Chloroflexus sp.]